jgi:undecaprenyl diphosphate synthase
MMQSTSHEAARRGLHVAIIMDGNGRWACARGLPRSKGHLAGVEAVRRAAAAAPGLGISTLTLHAFSAHNWERPSEEVGALFEIFEDYLRTEIPQWLLDGVRLSVLGRRNRVPASLREAIARAERETSPGRNLRLRLAIDYSSREAILGAAICLKAAHDLPEYAFARGLGAPNGGGAGGDVDLLIRTGGEQRLSDFMLWECAFAELYFTRELWPDFNADSLADAVRDFHSRDRRFGRIAEPAVAQ